MTGRPKPIKSKVSKAFLRAKSSMLTVSDNELEQKMRKNIVKRIVLHHMSIDTSRLRCHLSA